MSEQEKCNEERKTDLEFIKIPTVHKVYEAMVLISMI